MNLVENASAERTPLRLDVIVIGAGQAGLAMGYYLAREGRRDAVVGRRASVIPPMSRGGATVSAPFGS